MQMFWDLLGGTEVSLRPTWSACLRKYQTRYFPVAVSTFRCSFLTFMQKTSAKMSWKKKDGPGFYRWDITHRVTFYIFPYKKREKKVISLTPSQHVPYYDTTEIILAQSRLYCRREEISQPKENPSQQLLLKLHKSWDSNHKTKKCAGRSLELLSQGYPSICSDACEQVYWCPVSHVNEIISARILDATVSMGFEEKSLNRLFCSPVTAEMTLVI